MDLQSLPGCPFACSYCYAAFLPQNKLPPELWGTWFSAKTNAVELAQRDAPRVAGGSVYISSVTDPYLWAEKRLRLTRGILEALLPHQPRLMIQTRGPLVVRDIDLFLQFNVKRVQVSIPTDSEATRLAFEPKAPALEKRWAAVRTLKAAGIPTSICVSPMLPLVDPLAFAQRLREVGVDRVSVVKFRSGTGRFRASTGATARRLLEEFEWTDADFERCLAIFRQHLPLCEEELGYAPPSMSQGDASLASQKND